MKTLFRAFLLLTAFSLRVDRFMTADLMAQPTSTATVTAHCLSFQLQAFTRSDATYGDVTAYFTTYTGTDLYPPLHDISGANWVFSSEVRPLEGQPGAFGTDYLSFSSISGLFQYGHLMFNVPISDSDGNGAPDFLQRERAVNLLLSGVQTVIYPFRTSVNVTGTMTRPAGQVVGDLSFNNGIDHPGKWSIPNLSGTVTYTRGSSDPLRFALVGTRPDGATRAWTGSARATITHDAIDFGAFTLTREDNAKYQTAVGFSATRAGNRYAGLFQVVDGLPDTSWPDYKQWILQITDTNDSDGDGIPDLTDALVELPKISAHPLSQTAVIGSTVTFNVTASGGAPLQFQWQKNGVNLPLATDSSFTLAAVRQTDAGGYRVLVSNTAGSVTSQEVALDVKLPGPPRLDVRRSAFRVAITLNGATGAKYQLEVADQLPQGPWQTLVDYFPLVEGQTIFDNIAIGSRFYRAVAAASEPDIMGSYVTVGDPGNAVSKTTTYGAVGYTFQIQKFEFTNAEYVAFLNAVGGSNPNGIYSSLMMAQPHGGITQSGFSPNFTYAVKPNMGDKPVNWVSWFEAARVANWLHNGRLTNAALLETGAYTLNNATTGVGFTKNAGAKYWIPSEDEWYKAACYKGGGASAAYWVFSTQSDSYPTFVSASPTGVGSAGLGSTANSINGNFRAGWNGEHASVTTVGSNGGPSPYGTYDMSGNVWEWTDGVSSGTGRVFRGGGWGDVASNARSNSRVSGEPRYRSNFVGFRLARIPVP